MSGTQDTQQGASGVDAGAVDSQDQGALDAEAKRLQEEANLAQEKADREAAEAEEAAKQAAAAEEAAKIAAEQAAAAEAANAEKKDLAGRIRAVANGKSLKLPQGYGIIASESARYLTDPTTRLRYERNVITPCQAIIGGSWLHSQFVAGLLEVVPTPGSRVAKGE